MKIYLIKLFIVISFISNIFTCYGMQQASFGKQIRQHLQCPISLATVKKSCQHNQQNQRILHNLLINSIQGDDPRAVGFLLPSIDACYTINNPSANCIAMAQGRVRTFGRLSNIIRQQKYSDPKLPEIHKRYGRASNILGMLKVHRDEQLLAAVYTGDLNRTCSLLKLGAHFTRIFRRNLGGCHFNLNAFQMADQRLRLLSFKNNPKQSELETARTILDVLCNRRNEVFFTAIRNGNPSLMQKMLEIGSSPTTRTTQGLTAIALAYQLAQQSNGRSLLIKRQAICTLLESSLRPVETPHSVDPVAGGAVRPPSPQTFSPSLMPDESIAPASPRQVDPETEKPVRLPTPRVFSPQILIHNQLNKTDDEGSGKLSTA